MKISTMKISTMTCSAKIPNCELNLWNIERYLELDEIIVGIKTNNGFKGTYWTNKYKRSKNKKINSINKNSFSNQISVIINTGGNYINVKIFKNGSLHLTGCKSIEMARTTVKVLLRELYKLIDKKVKILLTKDENGVLLDKNNFIYSHGLNCMTIGYIDCDKQNVKKYIICNKTYRIDNKTNMFICEKMETKRQYKILNLSGEHIGYKQINLTKGNSKFYNKYVQYDEHNNLIYCNNNVIGTINYNIKTDLLDDTILVDDIQEINYGCNPFIKYTYSIFNFDKDSDKEFDSNFLLTINCINISFDICKRINREKLYRSLVNDNYICKFKPETYSGIKLVYKIDKLGYKIDGKCHCSVNCTCEEIIFLIFQTGKVLATGFKNTENIETMCNNFKKLCDKYGDDITRKILY